MHPHLSGILAAVLQCRFRTRNETDVVTDRTGSALTDVRSEPDETVSRLTHGLHTCDAAETKCEMSAWNLHIITMEARRLLHVRGCTKYRCEWVWRA